MSARDNIRSTRSREDIDFDVMVRSRVQELRFEMLGAFGGDKYRAVIEELGRLALDQKTPRRTRVVALTAYARAAGLLVQQAPQFNLQQGIQIDAASLLRLVQAEGIAGTAGCMSASERVSLPPETPTDVLQSDPRLRQAGFIDASEDPRRAPPQVSAAPDRTDGLPWRVSSEPAPGGPPPSAVSREPAGTAGDPTRCARCHARTDDEPHACPVPEDA